MQQRGQAFAQADRATLDRCRENFGVAPERGLPGRERAEIERPCCGAQIVAGEEGAAALRTDGLRPGVFVGGCTDRTLEMGQRGLRGRGSGTINLVHVTIVC